MADWPPELPDLQLLGLTEERQDGRLRSQMDTGQPKVRRRFTAVVRRFQIPTLLTGEQKIVFDDFYATILLEGSLPFTWEDPVTDAVRNFQFIEPPTFRLDLGNPNPDRRLWSTTLALELLP